MALIDSLISYYSLDEASGNALDTHGGLTLTETGGTIASTTGRVGNCRDFELGDTEHFARADNASHSTGDIDFTIAGWANLESKPGAVMDIVAKWAASQQEYRLSWQAGTDRFALFVSSTGSDSTSISADNFGGTSTATWYHVVGWHDSVNNLIGVSVNGVSDTTSYSSGGFNGTADFTIGGRAVGSNNWDGLIDEVGFWKRVLTADERAFLYNGGAGRSYADLRAITRIMNQYRRRRAG